MASKRESPQDSLTDERKAYVESRTRRILEGRGVDLQAGERKGTQVGEDELRDLEGIVGEMERRKEDEHMEG